MMIFFNEGHKSFYNEFVEKTASQNDVYRKALFYALGLTDETRRNVDVIYNFEEGCINPDALSCGWQTSTSVRITQLAFNLFNNFVEEECQYEYTPENLFSDGLMMYMFEAVKLRYPENSLPVKHFSIVD